MPDSKRLSDASPPARPYKSWQIIAVWAGVFLIHSLTYLIIIPPWQAPDEPTSFELLLTIEARGRLVSPGDAVPDIQREIIASMERNRFWELGGYGGRPLTNDDRDFRTIWSCCYTQLNRPPLYHLLLLPAAALTQGRPVEQRLRLLRLMTILLSAVTVAVIARIGYELAELLPTIQWVLPALVALSPQFAYTSATFTSDNLAALLCALIFWRLMRVLRHGLTFRLLSELCLLFALGMAAKRTTLLAVPSLSFALIWQAAARKGPGEGRGSKAAAVAGGGVALLCAVIAAVPALRSGAYRLLVRYVSNGDPANYLKFFRQFSAARPEVWTWVVGNVEFLNNSFWGSFGWHTVHIAAWASNLLLALLVAGWASAAAWLLRSRSLPPWCVRFVWACILGAATAILLVTVGTPPEVAPQGRYLFTAIVPIFLPAAAGVCCRLPRRWELLGVGVIVSGLLALDLYAILRVVAPAYLS